MSEEHQMPKRIQRKRSKGWRMPAGAVYVGRGSKWGNPFKIEKDCLFAKCRGESGKVRMELVSKNLGDGISWDRYLCLLFQCWVCAPVMLPDSVRNQDGLVSCSYTSETVRRELAGKDLACWCGLDCYCHADVLLRLANGEDAS